MVLANVGTKKVQAGTLRVIKGDVIIPSKLKLLAEGGWSISDAVKVEGGFELLMTRPFKADSTTYEPITPPVHIGGSRCPMYCDCL